MERAWLFARTLAPSDDSVMVAGNTQIEKLRRYCKDQGYKEVGFTEVHGSNKPEDLSMLLDNMKKANVNMLLITSLSRLSREWQEIEDFLKVCREAGISVCSTQEGKLSEFTKTFGSVFRSIADTFAAEISDEEEDIESGQEMIQT